MDKFFENMDNRFKSIENELDFKSSPENWTGVESMLDDAALDSTFIDAAKVASVSPIIDLSNINDAFLDDAFVEATNVTKSNYQSKYFNDYKANESDFVQNDSFTSAAAATKASYLSEYWNDADIALQKEGLHHEYKAEYWSEAEKLLAYNERKGFFLFWGSVATILLLISFIGLQINDTSTNNNLAFNNIENNTLPTKHSNTENSSLNNSQTDNIASNVNQVNTDLKITNKSSAIDMNNENLVSNDLKEVRNKNSNQTYNNTLATNPANQIGLGINKTNNNQQLITDDNSIQNQNTNNVIQSNNNNNSLATNTANQIALGVNQTNNNQLLITDDNSIQTDNNTNLNNRNKQTDINTVSNTPKKEHINKIKSTKIELLNPNSIEVTTPIALLKIEPIVPKANHKLNIKLEKGIGNVYSENNNLYSARNAFYLGYDFTPLKRFKNFSFGIDAGLYHMNLDNLVFEQNYSVYKTHGEVDHLWSKIIYKDLVFVSTNLNLNYALTDKHSLKFSIGAENLLTSRIDMKYKYNNELSTINKDNAEWGINKGINTFDLSFGLGYEYKLNTKFSFLLDSKFGAIDKTNNNYLRNNITNRDVSVLLGLKFNIFASH